MDRRDAIRWLSAGTLGAAGLLSSTRALASDGARQSQASATRGAAPVTIRDIQTVLTAPNGIRLVLVKVQTSEPGLYGWGCATFTQRALVVQTAIEQYLKPFLVGRNVDEIEDIWQSSYVSSYWRNGPVLFNAMSGVDIALWDIKGKRAGMPLYQLLGGKCRIGATCYYHAVGPRFQEVEENARKGDGAGYRHIRVQVSRRRPRHLRRTRPDRRVPPARRREAIGPTNARLDLGIGTVRANGAEAVRALRKELGEEVELLHDVHERVTLHRGHRPLPGARAISSVLPRGSVSAGGERPLPAVAPPDDHAAGDGRAVQHAARVRAADRRAADRLHPHPHLADWRPVASAEGAGAERVLRREDRVARARRRLAARPCRAARTRARQLQLRDSRRRGFPQETRDVFRGCPETKDGMMLANDKPGLGIDVDEKLAAKFPFPPGPPNFDYSWGLRENATGPLSGPEHLSAAARPCLF